MHLLESRRPAKHQRGAITILIVLSMIGLLAMAALAIDGAYMYTTRAQLQHVADSGALAGIGAVRDGLTRSEALAAAKAVVEAPGHAAGGEPVEIEDGVDLVVGTYDLATGSFRPGNGGPGVSAVRSTVRRSEGSPSGALELFLAGVIGVNEVDIEASAIAAVRKRDLVLVQDRTFSFVQEFEDARTADLALVDAISGPRALAGDRIGIVSFNRIATEDLELVPVDTQQSTIVNTIEALEVCPDPDSIPGCGGTGTADAIDAAVAVFERDSTDEDAEKIMLMVTDGVPCHNELGAQAVVAGQAAALEAAERARAAGINTYIVTLAIPAPGICRQTDEEFAARLVSGFGYSVSTPDPEDLDDLLVSIVQQMPVRLVE